MTDRRARAPDLPQPGGAEVSWPVRSGRMPPLAAGFVARHKSAAGLPKALAPWDAVALTSATSDREARAPLLPESPDWSGCCGKTQLAVSHAEFLWQAGELELLVWVTAVSRAAILSAYAAAASAVLGTGDSGDAEATARRFLGWLSQTSRSWLIVLDGLASAEDMEGLWPTGPAGRMLVTTALPQSAFGPQQLASFPIGGLSRRESLSYVLGLLTDDRGQRTGAIDLVDLLGGEPLALMQARAVVDSSGLSCREYTDMFARKRAQLAASFAGPQAAAAVSWTLCVEQACRILPGAPVQAMLVLAAVLDGHWIPAQLFTAGPVLAYARDVTRRTASHEEAWACVDSLQQAGLVTIDQSAEPALVRIALPVQVAVRQAASPDLLERAAVAAARGLLDVWPEEDAGTTLGDSLRSCAMSVAGIAGDALWTAKAYQLLIRTGRSLQEGRPHLDRRRALEPGGRGQQALSGRGTSGNAGRR